MPKKENLSIREAAQWLGVAPRTVYRLAQQGELPSFKVGGQWRFSLKMLERWIEDQAAGNRARGARRGKEGTRGSS